MITVSPHSESLPLVATVADEINPSLAIIKYHSYPDLGALAFQTLHYELTPRAFWIRRGLFPVFAPFKPWC